MELSQYLAQDLPLPNNWQNLYQTTEKRLEEIVKAIYLHFLISKGGFLSLPVVSNNQTKYGPIWQTCSSENLYLSENSSQLLDTLQKSLQKEEKLSLPNPKAETGDIFFFHALYRKLRRDIKLRLWASSLRRKSPLTRLLRTPFIKDNKEIKLPDGQKGKPAVSPSELYPIIKHSATIYFISYLADQWGDVPPFDPEFDYSPQLDRINTKRATIHNFIRVCSDTGRLSLLAAVLLFLRRLIILNFEQKVAEIMQFRQLKLSLREQIFHSYLGLLTLEREITSIYQREISSRTPPNWQYPEENKALIKLSNNYWGKNGWREKILQKIEQLENIVK